MYVKASIDPISLFNDNVVISGFGGPSTPVQLDLSIGMAASGSPQVNRLLRVSTHLVVSMCMLVCMTASGRPQVREKTGETGEKRRGEQKRTEETGEEGMNNAYISV